MPEIKSYFAKNPLIYVENKQLFKNLNDFFSQLSAERMANYMCLTYVNTEMGYLGMNTSHYFTMDTLQNIKNFEDKFTGGSIYEKDKVAQIVFPLISNYLFVSKCVDLKVLERIQKMVDQIKVCIN